VPGVTQSALVAPRGLIWDGARYGPRRMGFVPAAAPLTCRRGHEIRVHTEVMDGMGAHVCQYRVGGQLCREVIIVIEGSAVGSFRADLTYEEWTEIQRLRWRAAAVLDYCGAGLTNREAG
jgi:hypothetical protein